MPRKRASGKGDTIEAAGSSATAREKVFSVDDTTFGNSVTPDWEKGRAGRSSADSLVSDPIVCICASETTLIVVESRERAGARLMDEEAYETFVEAEEMAEADAANESYP